MLESVAHGAGPNGPGTFHRIDKVGEEQMTNQWTRLSAVGLMLLLSGGVWEIRAQQVDLLIREARVIDGTGSPWFVSDVAVDDGRIVGLGTSLEVEASQTNRRGPAHPRPGVLTSFVRERELLTLEDAIRRMTSLPARTFGFQDRGIIRPGLSRTWSSSIQRVSRTGPHSPTRINTVKASITFS
jgi:hypothetical protein